jgi:hypothetical protein
METSNQEVKQLQKRAETPWEKLGLDVVEYAHLVKSVEEDIHKKADEIRWKRECKKFENEPPFVFAGLGFIYWLVIIGMCFFVGYLLAQ